MFGRQSFGDDLPALLLLFAVLACTLAFSYSRAPRFEVGVAGRYDRPYLQDFHEPEAAPGEKTPSYRWTKLDSTVLAPGLGRGMWDTALTLSSPQPVGQPKRLALRVGSRDYALQLQATPRTYRLLTPSNGDMSVTIDAPLDRYGADPRTLGVVFAGAAFRSVAPAIMPPVWLSLHTVIALLLAYLTLRVIGLKPGLALVVPMIGLLLLGWGTTTNRPAVGLLAQSLSVLAAAGLVGVLLLRWAWNRLVALGRLEPEPGLLPALMVVFYLGFWIKATGLLYPYSHVIDVAWHMQRTREILGGRFFELYKPGAFSESVMPENEWGVNRPVIPYSPYFHILATSFAVFPWSLETTANIFSVFFDTNHVVLIAALALAFGLRSRGAFLAALLYAVTPFTFLLHSWGNIPTTFGIWWTLLATTLLALTFGRWHERRVWALLAGVLLLTFLFYTVMAVFMMVFLVCLWLGLIFFGRDLPGGQARPLFTATALAFGLSLLIYYAQYIPGIVERTLPFVNRTVVSGERNAGQSAKEPFWLYIARHGPRLGYVNLPVRHGLWLPLILSVPGLALLARRRFVALALGSWLIVAVLFLLVGSRVSMVDKHFFYIAPALTICTAALLERLWTRGRLMQGAIAGAYALTFAAALQLWIWRLQTVGS